MSNIKEVARIERKLYVTVDNKLVEVKQLTSLAGYSDKVVIYHKLAVKGKTQGKNIYAVGIEDYVPQPKTTITDKIATLKAQGLSDTQVLAMLAGTR
jgi:Tol biopolymer transport system component